MNFHNRLHALKLKASILYKEEAESNFWRDEINRYIDWYNGKIKVLNNVFTPSDCDKIKVQNEKDSAILTIHRLYTERKYMHDLQLNEAAFQNRRVLDIGSGAIPGATCFENADIYCLEPLLHEYLKIGFPIHYYNCTFIQGYSENIPVSDGFFDAVVSTNALDHVDDIWRTSEEIRRVLKNNGLLRFEVHYHKPTKCEPISLNDEIILNCFGWAGVKKISESQKSFTAELPDGESFNLWSNFK